MHSGINRVTATFSSLWETNEFSALSFTSARDNTGSTKMVSEEEIALRLFKNGNLDDARRKLLELEKDPKHYIFAHFHLSLIYYKKEKYPLALEHALLVRKENPKERNIHLNIGCIYDSMDDIEKAKRNYKRELELYPDCGEALYNLAEIYFRSHQWKTAAKYYEQCLELSYSIDDIILNLAFCYNKRNEIDCEIKTYQFAINHDSKDAWAMQNLGAALINKNQLDDALKWLKKAEQIDPTEPFIKRKLSTIMSLKEAP